MWVIILVVVIFIIWKLIASASQDAEAIKREGGMRNKFSVLIDYFMSGSDRCRIISEKGFFISLGVVGPVSSQIYYITASSDVVVVRMEMSNNPLFGNKTIKWTFPVDGDQSKMISKIESDLEIEYNKMLNSRL